MMEQIPRRLKIYRQKAGFSQIEVAEKLHIHVLDVIQWEKGEKLPQMSQFSKLSQLYGVSCDELLIF